MYETKLLRPLRGRLLNYCPIPINSRNDPLHKLEGRKRLEKIT